MIYKMARLYFLIVIICLSASMIGFGQTNLFLIEGSLVDASGGLIPNGEVTIRNIRTGKERSYQTDSSGKFLAENIRRGSYLVVAKAKGFSTGSAKIVIDRADVKNLKIRLFVGDIAEQVNITANRTQVLTGETAVSVSVLDRESIERKNINTIGDAFRSLPGVSTVNEGSFQVRPRIRGFDSNRVLVLVDGERLNNSRTSTIQSGIEIGLVGTDQIETLEVVRGSGSVLYGTDALGGTINIITRDAPRNVAGGFKFGGAINGFYNANGAGRRGNLALTGSSKFFSFRASQSLERYSNYSAGDLDGRAIDGVDPGGEVLNSQSHGSNTKITTRFFFDDNNDLRLNYDRRRVGNIGVPTLVGIFNASFPFSNRDKFNLRYETRNLTTQLARITASFYFQNQERNFKTLLTVPAALPFFPGQVDDSSTRSDTDSLGLDFQSDWILGNKNFLTAGFSFFRDKNHDTRFQDSLVPNFRTFPASLDRVIDDSPSVPNAEFGSFAVFMQDQFEVTNRIKLVGGIRIERFFSNSSPTANFVLPGILTPDQIESLGLAGLTSGLNVNQNALTGDIGGIIGITDDLSVTARIGRSFRVPNLFERFFTGTASLGGLVVGNPNLESETGTNFDASLRFRNSKFASSVTYFNNFYRNLLSNEPVGIINGSPVVVPNGLFQTVNIGRARIQGVEVEVEVPIKLGLGFLTPGGSLSYLRGDDIDNDVPLTTISPLKTVLNVQWQNFLNNYYLDWTTRIVNKQTRLSPAFLVVNGGPEPGFVVSDIGGGYVFKRDNVRMSFNVGVKNIFDRLYSEQFVLAPARGRSFVFGTAWEFGN